MAHNNPAEPFLVNSHLTMMSVMFGVALGFWVNTVHAKEHWSWPLGTYVLLTLGVIVSVYWWYVHLCSHYPSHTLFDYFVDFVMVAGLCSMSLCSEDSKVFQWTVAWGFLALVATAKLLIGLNPVKPEHKDFVRLPRLGAIGILCFAIYAAKLTYKYYETAEPVTLSDRTLTWAPVALGIFVTLGASLCRKKIKKKMETGHFGKGQE